MITVIIPAYNAAKTLGECLIRIQQQVDVPDEVEIIVVDDGSKDETAVIAQTANVRLIQTPQKQGAAAARNAGIRAAQGELICFTDADCWPRPNWLSELVKPFMVNEVIGCKGIYESDQPELVARFVQLEYEDKYDLLRKETFIDFIDTYSAAYRTHALRRVGGFDEAIFYVEDQELSFRLAAKGEKMVFQPSAVVQHFHSSTLRGYMRKKFMIGYWKSQILRRYPNRAVKDSHTPQVLKLQLVLAALILGFLFLGIIFPPFLIVWLLLITLFVLSALPFMAKAWPKDRAVALASPFLLFCRALGLGFGTAVGILRKAPHIDTPQTTA